MRSSLLPIDLEMPTYHCTCIACQAREKRAQAARHAIKFYGADPELALYEVLWPGKRLMKATEKKAA
jgi:hypothetical protein